VTRDPHHTPDPLDNLADPVLGAVFRHLTSDPTPDELSGADAALAMFRSASSRPAPVRSHRSRRAHRRSRVGGRLVAAGVALAVLGGFVVAAYVQVLPEPLQRLADHVIGVSSRPPVRPGVTVSPSGMSSSAKSRPSHPSSRSQSPRSPHPRSPSPSVPAGSPSLTFAATRHQITAGGSVRIVASLGYGGRPAKNIQLSLTELPGGRRSTWRLADRAATGPQGRAVFTVASLTTNASFRVTGPHQITSGELSIVVIPSVSATLVTCHGRHSDLLVAVPFAQRGDVVELEVSAAGRWQVVRHRRLHKTGRAEFSLGDRRISVTYRVVLLATAEHGRSVSSPVTVPARDRWEGDSLGCGRPRGGDGDQVFVTRPGRHDDSRSPGH
jgi:hypothetical protein